MKETPYAVCSIATDITASKRAEEIQVERARQVEVESELGEGTLVTVSLPVLNQLDPIGTKGPVPSPAG